MQSVKDSLFQLHEDSLYEDSLWHIIILNSAFLAFLLFFLTHQVRYEAETCLVICCLVTYPLGLGYSSPGQSEHGVMSLILGGGVKIVHEQQPPHARNSLLRLPPSENRSRSSSSPLPVSSCSTSSASDTWGGSPSTFPLSSR